jgi:hypothetical protein
MKWISDGDGNYESECGRMFISRRYWPDGDPAGWGVDIEGESGTAHLTDTFAAAKAWAREEARTRGWLFKLKWECQGHGDHVALLPDGAKLIASIEYYEHMNWWQCHRKRGDEMRYIVSASSLRELKAAVKEVGEGAYL